MQEIFKGKITKGIAGFYYVYVPGKGMYECKAKGILPLKISCIYYPSKKVTSLVKLLERFSVTAGVFSVAGVTTTSYS